MSDSLAVRETNIQGFYVVDLVLNKDERGWFKENYQKEKLEKLGLPTFNIIQNNFSYNEQRGVTRGLHAEPWEKYISVANGKVFGAWVDLRQGDSFGQVFTIEITPEIAVFVPRGVANAYQTLEDKITYTYLVNAHWSPDAKYAAINMADESLGINWPIDLAQAIVSEKDKNSPMLKDIEPMVF
jgi:dTDP-4-dehydrorhamnose 3,5-epimerase